MIDNKASLLIIPLVVVIVIFGVATITINNPTSKTSSFEEANPADPSVKSASGCDSCPDAITKFPCSTSGNSVLGGLDFVQYFTDFKLEDSTYDESQIGSKGDDDIYSMYKGFKYNFLTNDNKALFDANPEQYLPQWGGYCAWGMSGEYCPEYPWDSDCLGPSGNWGHWTIVDEKLYFFLFSDAKSKFTSENDPSDMIVAGNARWESWFGDDVEDYPMSTSCYVSTVTD